MFYILLIFLEDIMNTYIYIQYINMISVPFQEILAEESRGTRGGFSWIGARQMALLGGLSRVQATEKRLFRPIIMVSVEKNGKW